MRLIIVNRKRALISIFILTIVVLGIFACICNPGKASGHEETILTHTVEKGETLWEIAEKYNTGNNDIRYVISQIREYNTIGNNSYITPGQILYIPQ